MSLLNFDKDKVFTPTVSFANRISFLKKFFITGIILTFLFSVGLFLFVTNINRDIAMFISEQEGLRYVSKAQRLLEDLQQHRGLLGAYLSGYKNFEKELSYKRSEIGRDFAELESIGISFEGRLKTGTELVYINDIKNEWLEIGRIIDDESITIDISFEKHTHIIQDILVLISQIGDTSGLTTDTHPDSLYIIDTIINHTNLISESMGQARVAGLTMQVNKNISQSDRQFFLANSIIVDANMDKIRKGMQMAFKENTLLREQLAGPLEDTMRETDSFLEIINKRVIRAETNKIERLEYYTTITRMIDHVFKISDIATASLDNLLNDRVSDLQTKRNIYVLSFSAILILMTYLFVALYLKSRQDTNILDRQN